MTSSESNLAIRRGRRARDLSGSGIHAALGRYLYRPKSARPGAALVVVLHGCTQSAEGHARSAGWLDLADREGFVVLAPEQTRSGNANLCFNWFTEHHGGSDGEEVQAILAMIEDAVARYRLDRSRVFITGLSAGGAMAFALILHHPQVFAGAGIIAGLPAVIARDLKDALALMRGQGVASRSFASEAVTLSPRQAPRLSVWHGTADTVVSPLNADAIARQWIALTGLATEPDRVEHQGTRSRQVWTNAADQPVLEVNRLSGFGHATPLATRGPQGVGHPAAHMVECGQSSTRNLAIFWGLIDPESTADRAPMQIATSQPALSSSPCPVPTSGLRQEVVTGLRSHVPKAVCDLIDRSLRQAGL